jgi:enoyl-CoA hydratase/carnithine racemase
MLSELRLGTVDEAYADLQRRTLAKIPGNFARLIYLASTRDYNSARYYHSGLADRFSPHVAEKALELAHRDVFRKLSTSALAVLAEELDLYMRSTRENPLDFFRAWQAVEPFRVVVPVGTNPTSAALFISNVRFALAVLRSGQQQSFPPPDR